MDASKGNQFGSSYTNEFLNNCPLDMLTDLYDQATKAGKVCDMALIANTMALKWYQLTLVNIVRLEAELKKEGSAE